MQDMKRRKAHRGCLVGILREQRNAIRVDCVIFQSLSTLQRAGDLRCIQTTACEWHCIGEIQIGAATYLTRCLSPRMMESLVFGFRDHVRNRI